MPKKWILLVAGALLLPGCDMLKTADVATRYVAKMTCSCVYVVERDMEACLADLPEATAQVLVKNDSGKSEIEASILFIKARARHKEGEGCKITG